MLRKIKEVKARKNIGRKTIRGKQYTYEYYTLPVNLYLPKKYVEKFGTEFTVEINEDKGTITIKPRKHS